MVGCKNECRGVCAINSIVYGQREYAHILTEILRENMQRSQDLEAEVEE